MEKRIKQIRDYLVQLTIVRFDSKLTNEVYENEYNDFPRKILSLFSDFQKKEKERICGELEKSKKGVEYLHEITTQGAKTEKQIHDLLKMREGYNQAIDDALAVVKGEK